MTMCFIRNTVVAAFLFLYGLLQSQDNYTGYLEPNISLNYTVVDNYSHNFKVSQRSFLFDDDFEFRARQLDVAHFSNLKIRDDQSIAFGTQYRFRKVFEDEKENELRLTQQYNIKTQKNALRFGNRFRTEQRITASLTTHRFRYRFALDLPLNGEKLDIGEAYFVISVESLLSMAKGQLPEYDQRLTSNIGWLLNKMTKVQIGLEYRAEDFTHETENVTFIRTGLVLNL